MQWSIRNLLNPVIARCLIYGLNPFDLEYVLRQVESKPMVNSKMLESTWMTQWGNKAEHFIKLAKEAETKENIRSMSEYYMLAARCYYACYLLNSDEIENKRMVYEKLSFCYKESIMNSGNREEEVQIPFADGSSMAAYLHLPEENTYEAPYPCVVIFTGYGSCKEELEVKARPLVDRGIAVLAVDLPGAGESLFRYNIKLSGDNIEIAIEQIMKYLTECPKIKEEKIGTYGLCMGGGFAYRAAAKFPNIKCCVNLFPLFITMLEENAIPRWMKQGKWADFQLGNASMEEIIKGMRQIAEGSVSGRYLLVHSSYDNWMNLEKTQSLYDKTTGEKQEITVTQPPVYATAESVMHAMPVGEQMHWIKIQAADFFAESFRKC